MRYRLFGLEIEADRELALLPGNDAAPVDVRIASKIIRDDELSGSADLEALGDAVRFTVPGVGLFTIARGTSIAVAHPGAATPAEVELFLLGSAMGLLLQQRGILALHANAVSDGTRALAVAAPSGSGKSTLAARLVRRGFALLSDDVCAIEMGRAQGPCALPGPPRFRLWGDALDALGEQRGGLRPVQRRIDKYDMPLAAAKDAPAPLAAIYVLGESEDIFGRLSGTAAVEALMGNSYRGQFNDLTGATAAHFEQCVTLARAVPIFRWQRRWGRDHEEANVDALLAHAAGLGFGAQ